MQTIAITGATGHVGRRVADRLSAVGVSQRLIVRDLDRAPSIPGSEVVAADYSDLAAAEVALAGTRTLFMVSGAESADRVESHKTFVDAAAAVGVEHIVYLSLIRPAPDATFTLARDHWATEEHIKARGLTFTFLRDSLYSDFAPQLVGTDGVIRGPAGDGRLAGVCRDDVAEAAATVLRTPQSHSGQVYSLTGPVPTSLDEIALALRHATGRSVTYYDETVEQAYASRAGLGAPQWQLDAWVSTYLAIRKGDFDQVSDDVERLTGHPSTPLPVCLSRL